MNETLIGLEDRVDLLEQSVDQILDHLATETEATQGPAPWLHAEPAPDINTDLTVWVTWWKTNYEPAQAADRIPECWLQHPGLVAELMTLWHVWQAAFLDPKANPEAAQNWHDRWLPGFLGRIPHWVPNNCMSGPSHGLAADHVRDGARDGPGSGWQWVCAPPAGGVGRAPAVIPSQRARSVRAGVSCAPAPSSVPGVWSTLGSRPS